VTNQHVVYVTLVYQTNHKMIFKYLNIWSSNTVYIFQLSRV